MQQSISKSSSSIINQLFARDNTAILEDVFLKSGHDIAELDTETDSDIGSSYDSGFCEGDFLNEFDSKEFSFYSTFKTSEKVDNYKTVIGLDVQEKGDRQNIDQQAQGKYAENLNDIISLYSSDFIKAPEMIYERESSKININPVQMELKTIKTKYYPNVDFKQELAVKSILGSYFSCLA